MEPAIEEFNLLYPNYLISSIDGSVEVVETCPRSDLDFRRLVVTGCMGYVFPRELKSSFASAQIARAKEQIIGTLLRLKAQMSILQSNPNWEYHGIIVSYAPTEAQLIAVNKLTSRDGWFSR